MLATATDSHLSFDANQEWQGVIKAVKKGINHSTNELKKHNARSNAANLKNINNDMQAETSDMKKFIKSVESRINMAIKKATKPEKKKGGKKNEDAVFHARLT